VSGDMIAPGEGARITYLRPKEDDPEWGPRMRFRLTYQGELKASGRDPETGQRDRMAEHKQSIRKVFHGQLKRLWQSNKFLREHRMGSNEAATSPAEQAQQAAQWGDGPNTRVPMAEAIAAKFRRNGYRFVPLVCEDFSLLCSLDILFLRRDFPLGVISAGDLDNRVKTLIDALRMPKSANELRGNEMPGVGEDPFFCLLEDDDLVTALTVETDMLLDPPNGEADHGEVKLVISVELKPYDVNMFNLSFA
jgi:hypothetical protein